MKSTMKDHAIIKVLYVAKTEELYIQFAAPVVLCYDTVAFVNVPFGAARRFKDATNREEYFNSEIRTKYKYYATHISFGEVQVLPPEPNTPKTYEEYCAKFEEELNAKEIPDDEPIF